MEQALLVVVGFHVVLWVPTTPLWAKAVCGVARLTGTRVGTSRPSPVVAVASPEA